MAFVSFIALCTGASLLLSPIGNAIQSEKAPVQNAEEYAVYSAILKAEFDPSRVQQLVVNIQTISAEKVPFVGFIGGLAPTGAKRPETRPETTTDFDSKNEKSILLEKLFDLKVPYVLVTDEKLKTIFVTDSNGYVSDESWNAFYKQYPGAPGILAFSRVGFDAQKTEAIVYVVIQSGLVGGAGRFFVLSKDREKWKVQKQVVIWLS